MKIKGRKCFLSGPMTGYPDLNVAAFAVAHHRLRVMGAECVYDPATKYLDQRTKLDEAMTHGDYVRRCINNMTEYVGWDDSPTFEGWYDVLVQLPGWEESEGARIECDVAKAIGMDVVALEDCE